VALECGGPEPLYTAELDDDGGDVDVRQSGLRLATRA
jgi:hypothetical protein